MLSQLAESYTYTYTTVNSTDTGGFWAALAVFWIFGLVLWVVSIIALWKVFEKAGIPGWKSIIPIYNSWLLFEMAGKPGWWSLVFLLMFIPIINFFAWIAVLVLWVIAALELGKAFGKDTAFSVLALIVFSIVGLLILGFGKDKYTKPATAPAKFS